MPTFTKLLHLQTNPRRALSQQVGYTRDTENKLSEKWVGFTCSSSHGVTCHGSLFGQYAFSNRSRHAPGLTHYLFNAYREPLFSGQKWMGHETDGIREPRAEVKCTCSSASTPSQVRYIEAEFLKLWTVWLTAVHRNSRHQVTPRMLQVIVQRWGLPRVIQNCVHVVDWRGIWGTRCSSTDRDTRYAHRILLKELLGKTESGITLRLNSGKLL